VLCGVVLTPPRAARAQDAKAAARAHFDRALAASNEQRFDDAAREFEEAYALAPDFKVLYNIGRVSALLGRPLRAVEAFEGYLAQGGDRVGAERRAEVQRLIDEQLPRLAALGVATKEGADVRVDGRLVGRAPLAGRLRLAAGPHTIEALLADRPPVLREVTLAGGSTTDLTLAFPATAAAPAATAPLELELSADPRPSPPAHRARRLAGFVAGGLGLVALAAGTALAYSGATDANAARTRLVAAAMPAPPAMPDVVKYDEAKIEYDDARTKNQLGWAMAGVGGLAVVAGAALILWSPAAASSTHVVASRQTFGLGVTW
jgi:hypothetical protein